MFEVTVISNANIILSGWVSDEQEIERCVEVARIGCQASTASEGRILVRNSGSSTDQTR